MFRCAFFHKITAQILCKSKHTYSECSGQLATVSSGTSIVLQHYFIYLDGQKNAHQSGNYEEDRQSEDIFTASDHL